METLKDIIFADIKVNNNDNYLIFNEGGIGKTTQMKEAYLELINSNIDKTVPIFIDCKSLNFKSDYPLLSAILEKYCGNDCMESTHLDRLKKLICSETPQKGSYKFIIFIDGINECESNKYKALQAINKLIQSPNNKIVVSSRINEDELVSKGFKKLKVKEFTDVQIITYLNSKGINNNGVSIELNRLNPSLLKILRIPMFLKLFAKTYSNKHIFPDIYTTNIVRKADLLQGFLDKILEDKKNQHDNKIAPEYLERKFALNLFLPALAFEMSLKSSFAINEKDITDIIDNKFVYDYFKKLTNSNDRKLIKNIDCNDVLDICKDEFSLITLSNKSYAFSHQVWQDFFCAKFYAMCIERDIIDAFDNSISVSVREFIGEVVKNENGECECDFEKKDDLKTWSESPIEQYLQKHNLNSSTPLSPLQTYNLIEIMKTSRNNNITANYRNLNLSIVTFELTNVNSSDFRGAKISDTTFKAHNYMFMKDKMPFSYFEQTIAFSPSGQLYACTYNYNIFVFETDSGREYLNTGFNIPFYNICIKQIAFISENIILIRYAHCIIFYDIEKNFIDENFVFYIKDNHLFSLDDFLKGKIKLSVLLNDINKKEVLSYIGETVVDLDKEEVNFLSKTANRMRKEFSYDTIESVLDKLDDILPPIPKDLDGRLDEVFNPVNKSSYFLEICGDKHSSFGNFTFDKVNNIIYIAIYSEDRNSYVFYTKLGADSKPYTRWFRFIKLDNYAKIISVDNHGLLAMPCTDFRTRNCCYEFSFISKKGKLTSYNLNDKIILLLEKQNIQNDFLCIDFVYLGAYDPILTVKYHYFIKNTAKFVADTVNFDVVHDNFVENITKKIDDRYFYLESIDSSDLLKDNYKDDRATLHRQHKILCYDKNAPYLMVHYKPVMSNEISHSEVQILDRKNLKKLKVITTFPSLENFKVKKCLGNYIYLYIQGFNRSFYYDIEKDIFFTLLNSQEEMVIESKDRKVILTNYGYNITMDSSDDFFNKISKKCNEALDNNLVSSWIFFAKIKNLCKYLRAKKRTSIKINQVDSGNYTFMYDPWGEKLLFNKILFNKTTGHHKISLQTVDSRETFIYNDYLISYNASKNSMKLFDLYTGALVGNCQDYCLDKIFNKDDIKCIEQNGFNHFANVVNLKLHISKKIYLAYGKTILVLDKNKECPEKTYYINDFISSDSLIKEHYLFRIKKGKFVVRDLRNSNSQDLIISKGFYQLADCRENFILALNNHNELFLWDFSKFDIKNIKKFRPIISFPLHYLTSFSLNGAIFDNSNQFNGYKQLVFKELGAQFID